MPEPEVRDELFRWYHAYVYSFAKDGVLLPAMKKLKYEHSQRVAQTARALAEDSRWKVTDVVLAELCGLYHDLGRYKQFREFKTFQDHRSINHAECGCAVMDETGCLHPLDDRERRIVYQTTLLHNRKELPADLDAELLPFAQLVRDADKLDIFYVIYDAVTNNRLHDYPEITHGVDLTAAPSEVVIEAARKRGGVRYSDARSLSDFLLIQMQWAFELYLPASCRLMQQRGIVGNYRRLLPDDPRIDAIAAAAEAHLLERVRAGV